ncbi:MAG TPA: VOC family protein [Nocardioides sp.]|nr:VOC family protein [Nocardioides sp.]
MALATFQDLCLDANDARRMGEFWAPVLGLELQLDDDGDARLLGPTPAHTVWINTVPEPVTVKQRVHLDVHAGSTDDVLALGATPEDLDSFKWDLLRDPEGGELCVFLRDRAPDYRLYEIVVDAVDHERIAAWWAEVLGAELGHDDEGGFSFLKGVPGAPFEYLDFGTVPEPKTVKNRIHWDVTCPDVAALVARGARVLREPDDVVHWTVMADPEGNEFCAFAPR